MTTNRIVSTWNAGLLLALAAGCSSTTTPELTNPFTTADRVAPPALRTTPDGVAPAYYPQGQATFAPAAPGAAPGVAPAYQGAPPASPYQAAPAYTPAPAQGPVPGSATPFYGAPAVGGPTASNEAPITIQPDSSSLRFASPSSVAQARQQNQPIARGGQTLAATSRPPATANAWVSGSAPVHSATPAASPRVRVPGVSGYREPVSLAALEGGVSITPLEPVPGAPPAGGAAPLRVATPQADTVWR
ncbi:hypothetical protein MalM25_20760 [Planctomycetes bacterium MalM25]|nr:hypothetical protein MalM25_20760 [Planctomycetes bacterium MalM25]